MKQEILNAIRSRIVLGLPLTEFERAFWILYGDKNLKV